MSCLLRGRGGPGVAVGCLVLLLASAAGAQETAPPPEAPDYLIPDLDPKLLLYDGEQFSLRVGAAVILDYTAFRQDDESEAQVGEQRDRGDLRSARILLGGKIKFERPWSYMIALDYNEHRSDDERVFEGVDAFLTFPLWGEAKLSVGKQKEPFVYEMVGVAANLPQQERILSPFFKSRNLGLKIQDSLVDDRITWSAGWFNDYLVDSETFDQSGNQVVVRTTGLPLASEDGRDYLHLGAGGRYNGADAGKLRFRGRPESNVADEYVDTGNLPAHHALELGLEALWNRGPLSLLGEYVRSWTEVDHAEVREFSGWYVTAAYVLTGENRPYLRQAGYARAIVPESRWGAFEVWARYSHVDLVDGPIEGGLLDKGSLGINWWASRQWKLGVSYGLADLEQFGIDGRTDMLLFRLQWVY